MAQSGKDLTPPIIEVDSISQKAKSSIPFDSPFILKIWTDEKPIYAFSMYGKRGRSGLEDAARRFQELTASAKCDRLEDKRIERYREMKLYSKSIDVIERRLLELVEIADTLKLQAKNLQISEAKAKKELKKIRMERRSLYSERKELLEKIRRGEEKRNKLKRRRYKCHCDLDLEEIKQDRMEIKVKDGRKYLLIKYLESDQFVSPARNLTVVFPRPVKGGLEVMALRHGGSKDKATEKMIQLRYQQLLDVGFHFNSSRPDELEEVYERVKPQLDGIDQVVSATNTFDNTIPLLDPGKELDELLALALGDTLEQRTECLVDCDMINDMLALRELDTWAVCLLIHGERLLHDPDTVKSDIKRIAALKDTRKRLDRIIAYSKAQAVMHGGSPPTELLAAQQVVIRKSSDLQSIEKNEAKVKNQLVWSFADPVALTGTSAIFDFDTRSAFQAIPDFGVVWYGFEREFEGPMPYFGVQFNVRQCNKNIPWSHYPNKTFWHHVSFSVGYTAVKLAATGEREDFFSKASMMTGVGWRFTHAIRATAGAMWFYALDPNPALDARTIAATPFIGVSFDLDVAKYLKDIMTALKP